MSCPRETAKRALRLAFELAGIVGVEPWSFTLWELQVMAESRSRHEWDQTSCMLALTEAMNSTKRVRFKPAKWNPWSKFDVKRRLLAKKRKHERS